MVGVCSGAIVCYNWSQALHRLALAKSFVVNGVLVIFFLAYLYITLFCCEFFQREFPKLKSSFITASEFTRYYRT